MTRIVLCDGPDAVETALLQDGHPVLRLVLPRGPMAPLTAWQTRRTAESYRPDCVMAAPNDPQAAGLARQLGVPLLAVPSDHGFLLERALPAAFRPFPLPGVGASGAVLLPGIVIAHDAAQAVLADCLAAGCAIVAPDTSAMRAMFGPDGALYHGPADTAARDSLVAALQADASRCQALGQAARARFDARHALARAALRAAAGT
jgi:hypothetical protein